MDGLEDRGAVSGRDRDPRRDREPRRPPEGGGEVMLDNLRISLEIDHLFHRELIGDFASVTTRFAACDHLLLGAIVLGRIKGRLRRNPRGFEPLTRPARDGGGRTTRGTRGARPS
jgi:hypothetical protein